MVNWRAIFVHFLWKSKIRFELKSVGINISVRRYAGMNITKSILITMAISGGLAGLTGAVLLAASDPDSSRVSLPVMVSLR